MWQRRHRYHGGGKPPLYGVRLRELSAGKGNDSI